jgi:CubicO group peptidase (beta-lactamase class C family)
MIVRAHAKAMLIAIAIAGVAILAVAASTASAATREHSAAMTNLLDYLRNQNSTGFLVVQDGNVLVEKNWPAPAGDRQFPIFVHGKSEQGALLEDVASQQKSFVSVLVAVAIDKGLIEIEKPVSAYIGAGWSRATPEQEAKIRVIDLLTMSSGLNDKFGYEAPAGTVFYYNTPVYAVTKSVVAAAAKQPLDTITRDWLTVPTGMNETAWRKRPAALASVGNDTGLVSTPRDIAAFGLMVLRGGVSTGGERVVSEANLKAMFTPSATNPAYARLWWLNNSAYTMRALDGRKEGPLIATAPADTIAALGFLERRLYVVPSRKLVVVRTGAAARDKDFDEQLWVRMMKVIDASATTAEPVVRAPAGAVRGTLAEGQHVFKGIPYALPPIGERRWKPPAPMTTWHEVRDATRFGPACQQPSAPAGSIYAETYPAMSEDCLSLNIWTPAEAKSAPVFVWIHGGNLVRGSSQQAMFDGATLVKRGIVVVSINYRLGVFGYFAQRELSAESSAGVSGNYGLLDQIAALHWVKRNIAAFGGDAANVTIAGESAGGLAILHLLASQRAHGLFAKAIVQSASLMNVPELKRERFGLPSGEAAGERLVAAAGAKSIAGLRAIDAVGITTLAQAARSARCARY